MTATSRISRTPRNTHVRDVRPASSLTGLGALARLFGRISRRQILIWFLAMLALVPASVLAMEEAYPDQQALDARAQLLNNPSAVLMTGPAFALDDYTFWAMVANELMLYILLAAAIMSVLLTVRHTRSEEEAGRLELLRALPVGRFAPAAAALIVVAIANFAVGTAVTLGVIVGGGSIADSLAMGLATALTGLVFAGIAAVAAQLTEHAGTASGLALGSVAVAFIVRGIGDVIDSQGSWLSWCSPFAWAQQTRTYVDLRWWPLALSALAIVLLLLLAGALARRRDLGAGLRPASPGRGTASSALLAPGGLARRLVTTMMISWAVGLFLFGVAFGTLASSLEDMVAEIPTIEQFAPLDLDDLTTSFAAYILKILALGPIGLTVAGVLRLRSEEQEGRQAGVLLAGHSRHRVALQWLLVIALEAFAVQVLLGLGVGLGVWQATGDPVWIADMTLASLAYLPAIALFGGVAMALYGLSPRLTGFAWALTIWTAIDTYLGDLLGLPAPIRGISPLYHVSLAPAADIEAAPWVALGALTLVLAAVGLLALRRRDIVAG